MGVLDKQFETLDGLHLMMDSPSGGGSTTLSAVAAAGATSFTIAAATNFAIGDDIRVGTGETMEMVRISNLVSTTVTPAKPLKFDHASGEAVVELSAISLGVPEADGVKLQIPAEATDVFNAIQRTAYGTLVGYVDLGLSWRFMAITADVIAYALGLPRSAVIGNGTAAAQTGTAGPRMFTTDGLLMGALANSCVVAAGRLQDGSYVRAEFYNVSFNPTQLTTTFSRGQLATVPVTLMASSGAFDFTNSAFTPANIVTTFASSNADLFSEITNVAQLSDSGTSNTTSGTTAAGAYTIVLTSATGFTANAWVKIGVGDLAEWHLIHSVSSNTLNLRTQVQRAFAASTAVVLQTVTQVAGITGGFTLSASGAVQTQRSEYYRTSLRYKIGNAAVQFAFQSNNLRPEILQLALGIPSSAIANNVVPLGNKIGATLRATLLFTGLTQDGKTITMCGWNGAAQINAELNLTQAAEMAASIAYKPTTMQLLVNA
jgi:hypothetical protein